MRLDRANLKPKSFPIFTMAKVSLIESIDYYIMSLSYRNC